MRATRAIIHLKNLAANIGALRAYLGGGTRPLICLPVKADAYGHGAVEIAKTALEAGVAALAVATVDEGAELREAGINAPILLFSPALPSELEAAASLSISPFVSCEDQIKNFARAAKNAAKNKTAKVFLKVDTGMNRSGCPPHSAAALARAVKENGLELSGCVTHLAAADSTGKNEIEWTESQLNVFKNAVLEIKNAGITHGILSAANSGGVFLHSNSWLDMVRPGIALYGYAPPQNGGKTFLAKPVMELVTKLVLIKKIGAGETVSYGRAWTAAEDTFIGILPIGYADGLPRILSTAPQGNFFVCIGGELYPLAGRICMDMCMVNLGSTLKTSLYDDAVIFGQSPPAQDAASLAVIAGTIPYEICCGISRRVPRLFLR
ncbi:MAG: alanine racemase [Spirochaetaceae bacterium]|jgi:alanine racemase|nr:alanine racemase [Spirochaetaceae bacterium]